MSIQLGMGIFNFITSGTTSDAAKLNPHIPVAAPEPLPLFSAQVEIAYCSGGSLSAFTVRFVHDNEPVYVRDADLLGVEGTECEDTAFRFFDWKNPVWAQIVGTIIRENRTQYENFWYTQAFTFTVNEDTSGVDYFGLRLKRGMFGFKCQDVGVCVVYKGAPQLMAFDIPYFILNPKDQTQDLIQIRQDRWMPLLVSAYALGSAVERRGRPYFSQAIEKILEWFKFMLGQMRNVTDAAEWDEEQAKRKLLGEMLRELWEKGPRRLVAFYSGLGYVINAMELADVAADVIHDFNTELSAVKSKGCAFNASDVSPRLFAVMLLLALRTEKARLYVTIDLNGQSQRESYTQRGIRELMEIKTLMELYFASQGQRYAPIKIPKPFELSWGCLEQDEYNPHAINLPVHYKRDIELELGFALCSSGQRYSVSLVQTLASGKQEWLGRIVLSKDTKTAQVRFIAESMTSNFRHLRDINAFKYILLVGAIGYSQYVLGADPEQIIFESDFFDHCAPYDLMLLQQCGWEPDVCDLSEYKFTEADLSPYSGRAMTLPVVRVPAKNKRRSSLSIYMLDADGTSVAIDPSLYGGFIAHIQNYVNWPIKTAEGCGVLVDGIPHHLADPQKFHQFFSTIFQQPTPFEEQI